MGSLHQGLDGGAADVSGLAGLDLRLSGVDDEDVVDRFEVLGPYLLDRCGEGGSNQCLVAEGGLAEGSVGPGVASPHFSPAVLGPASLARQWL